MWMLEALQGDKKLYAVVFIGSKTNINYENYESDDMLIHNVWKSEETYNYIFIKI